MGYYLKAEKQDEYDGCKYYLDMALHYIVDDRVSDVTIEPVTPYDFINWVQDLESLRADAMTSTLHRTLIGGLLSSMMVMLLKLAEMLTMVR